MNTFAFRRSIALNVLAAAVAVGIAGCSLPSKPTTKAAAIASKPISDGEILQVLQTVSEGEIKQAKVAVQGASSEGVRDVAQHIIKDHQAMNERVMSLSQATGIKLNDSPLDTGIRLQANEIAEDLAELSGQKFDCAYLQKQVEQHTLTIKTARSTLLPAADNAQVKELLNATLPILEQHEQHAQKSLTALGQC